MRVILDHVSISLGGRPFIDDLSLDVADGSFVAIVGPNGSGKSTLLRAMYRALVPDSGRILIGDTDVSTIKPRDAARLRAVVTQHQTSNDSLLVRDVIATGRHAHQSWFTPESSADRSILYDALAKCGAEHLFDRRYATLSGGERQRVLLARAISQEAAVLLLDEPTNHLDVTAQHDLLRLLEKVPLTRVVVLHDLNHAVAHADHVIVVSSGRIHASGPPTEVLSSTLTEEVFDCRSQVIVNPLTGRPLIVTAPLLQQD
ncbi:ABC transporter ATP-binding protein [Pseudoclavibacter sp. RFBJ3]|uniref:ABC transporter ATP-binding protein n=1 Tax=unclassified Pseudoclavibacter TaxID=2615177 RepID=UPI000CE8C69D|nr:MULTISPECIES: ABC transporter ATP-binding protein [unclassified Pseudoclavibacter]PPF87551.1 ABC transporter ATP-binding protein [Pseudoclavibacter sp. RFBJ5]PPF90401.1 ABC transporter ATP-binding protein [Pseudoclavibacter sp. RFBJ3]PPG01086.1 ABC transporter ATP-binding protein [Pseudoclavibacter sp. RFBH5]PPG26189.1 ABC transporter ATP-binding protein [Pseudoclavibacter sp. RFBI4]